MNKDAKIYVAGHRGMVGSAIVRCLQQNGYRNLLLRTSAELDLRKQGAVEDFFREEKPEIVFLAAARVGGIGANQEFPAEFIFENLAIQTNVIHSSHASGVKRLLFVASSCIYPRLAPQPMPEDCLLSGPLEPSNEPYAIAKIAGIKMCEAYRRQYGSDFFSVLPCNLYGSGDNYDPQTSHVMAALIRKCHLAKTGNQKVVQIWGTGQPRREFLLVDDAASACVKLMFDQHLSGWTNVGSGQDISIADLAAIIANVVGFTGEFQFNHQYPDGVPRKLLDIRRIKETGWRPTSSLEAGIRKTYRELEPDTFAG